MLCKEQSFEIEIGNEDKDIVNNNNIGFDFLTGVGIEKQLPQEDSNPLEETTQAEIAKL